MFSTIDLKSSHNQHVRADPTSVSVGSIGKPIQRRSKTGCLTCRKRKKKCDEARPTCHSCQKRGLECDWEIKSFKTKTHNLGAKKIGEPNKAPFTIEDISRVPGKIHQELDGIDRYSFLWLPRNVKSNGLNMKDVSRVENVCEEIFVDFSPIESESDKVPKTTTPIDLGSHANNFGYFESDNEGFDRLLASSSLETENDSIGDLLSVKSPQKVNDLNNNNAAIFADDFNFKDLLGANYFPLVAQPTSTYNLYLDDTGLLYLGYFENNVATLLSVSPRSSNYFLKTFFTLSITNESVLNALAAWGALFFNVDKSNNSNHDIVNHYLKKSKSLVKKSLQNKYDYFLVLSYYLINLGIQICSGDTNNWHSIFNMCWDLLAKYGGVQKFIKDFDYSNDCKFLIANLQFHDVMSSETLTNGTRCDLSNYNELFQIKSSFDDEDYGVDPYQGCIQPIVLLLGEIMNRYAAIRGVILRTEGKLNMDGSKSIDELVDENQFDQKRYEELNQMRIDNFESMDLSYNELKNKVKYCKPIISQLDQLPSEEEKSKHIKLFELYRMTCNMNLELYFKKVQPNSSEIQTLLLSCFKIIDDLIATNLKGAFNMTLLLCGIACCNQYDRMNLEKKFRAIYMNYKVGNVKRIWDIVKESWHRNSNGTTCVDWIDICNDFGWKLSLC